MFIAVSYIEKEEHKLQYLMVLRKKKKKKRYFRTYLMKTSNFFVQRNTRK